MGSSSASTPHPDRLPIGWGICSAECARPRAMPLGFRSIFFQVFAGVRTTSIERQGGEAQVGLGARVVRTRLGTARGPTNGPFVGGLQPTGYKLGVGRGRIGATNIPGACERKKKTSSAARGLFAEPRKAVRRG